MINEEKEFYKFLEDCIKECKDTIYSIVRGVKVGVIKFQNNFSSQVMFEAYIVKVIFYNKISYTEGNFELQTNIYEKEFLSNLTYDISTGLLYSKDVGLGGFRTFVYTERNKEATFKLFEQVRKDNIQNVIERLTKIQNNYLKLMKSLNDKNN